MALTINHQTNDISATSGSVTIDGASAGSSTTFGAVGTYIIGRPNNQTYYATNSTASGLLAVVGNSTNTSPYRWDGSFRSTKATTSVSGTWRAMTGTLDAGYPGAGVGLWVRIS